MAYRAGAREEVVAALLVSKGFVEDPGGRATMVLAQQMVDRVGVDPRKVQSLSELLGTMERAGIITRSIKGRRTYTIALVALTAELLRGAMSLLERANADPDLDPVGDPGDLASEAGFDVPHDDIDDRAPLIVAPLNFHNLDRIVVVAQQVVQALEEQREHIRRLSVEVARWQRRAEHAEARAERAEAEVDALRGGRVSGGG